MEFLTCLQGHRNPRERWRASLEDAACLLCPVCSEVVDDSKPARRSFDPLPSEVRAVPIGRRAFHITSLLRRLEAWIKSRKDLGLENKTLRDAVNMLIEYESVLTASDVDLATGDALDRLLYPIPREYDREGRAIETDAEYRTRAKRLREIAYG